MPGLKLGNQYLSGLQRERLYDATPKAVFAAIAVSALTYGGDLIDEAAPRVLKEWWTLYHNGIVPQKPPFPEPDSGYSMGSNHDSDPGQ